MPNNAAVPDSLPDPGQFLMSFARSADLLSAVLNSFLFIVANIDFPFKMYYCSKRLS